MSVAAARQCYLNDPTSRWELPSDGGLVPRAHLYGGLGGAVGEVFCHPERRNEWSEWGTVTSFEEFRVRLSEAGAALGLSQSNTIEDNITLAYEIEAQTPSPYEPWKTWAVIAETLLVAEARDHFLKL